jgi:hypothetical protein
LAISVPTCFVLAPLRAPRDAVLPLAQTYGSRQGPCIHTDATIGNEEDSSRPGGARTPRDRHPARRAPRPTPLPDLSRAACQLGGEAGPPCVRSYYECSADPKRARRPSRATVPDTRRIHHVPAGRRRHFSLGFAGAPPLLLVTFPFSAFVVSRAHDRIVPLLPPRGASGSSVSAGSNRECND